MGGPPVERAGADSRRSIRSQGILSPPRRLSDRLRREVTGKAGLVLILDYDGTLTPIVPTPDAAVLSTPVRRTLARLARRPRVRLAILSGRSLADVRRRVGVRNVVYAGCHGLEIRGAGLRWRHPGARGWPPRIRAATRILTRELAHLPGSRVEPKGLSVSAHYRGVPVGRRAEFLERAARVTRRVPGLRALHGKRVVEFLPRVSWGKGAAALWLATRLGRALRPRRAVILYAGDDTTDEAAFAALGERGVTVRVGARRGGAAYAVRNVAGLHALLRWLARTLA